MTISITLISSIIASCSAPSSTQNYDVVWNIDVVKASRQSTVLLRGYPWIFNTYNNPTKYHSTIVAILLNNCRILSNWQPNKVNEVPYFKDMNDLNTFYLDNRNTTGQWHHFACQASKYGENYIDYGGPNESFQLNILGETPPAYPSAHFVFEEDIRKHYTNSDQATYFVVAGFPHELGHYKWGVGIHVCLTQGNHDASCCLMTSAECQKQNCDTYDFKKIQYCPNHASGLYPP